MDGPRRRGPLRLVRPAGGRPALPLARPRALRAPARAPPVSGTLRPPAARVLLGGLGPCQDRVPARLPRARSAGPPARALGSAGNVRPLGSHLVRVLPARSGPPGVGRLPHAPGALP